MLLLMKDITKRFPGVLALDNVSFDLKKGEIHALVGENGAGKSTLIKILGGIHQPDSGKIILKGKEVKFSSPLDAMMYGISVIHQELNLAENLSVFQNIFLGREGKNPWYINFKDLEKKAKALLDKLGFDLDPRTPVKDLNVSEKQLVAIAKALAYDAEVLVMDEPTATLTEHEVERLFEIMKDLKSHGVSVIFISHRLDEIFEVADRVTVLRDGKKVGEGQVKSFTRNELVRLMVGREIKDMYPKYNEPTDEVIFSVEDFEVPGYVSKTSFEIRRGEIFGVAGLVGCGKSELALGLFGALKSSFSKMRLFGREIDRIKSPLDALKNGIVLIPEDRKKMGLILGLDIVKNITVSNTNTVAGLINIYWKKARKMTQSAVERFRIKTPSIRQLVKNLSGGNQQKVVLSKFLFREPKLVILAEPTRGIDVGAKVEVYNLINQLANEGKAVLFISSELPEIVSLSDRVMVLHRGVTTAIFEKEEITQENILKAATGVDVA
ncbi:MAG: D-xylose ABC transporter ATP-binding protein [Thermotoga sp. 4484_232]|nr:sugar ABC transporter ATP-binding protein [Candidatus Neomarinimicrobiota bacterium]OQX57286.1 MAG: D-xylose ABC transporter ATP-binding protein [Thermotoga sp. 4484_232]